MERLSQSSVLSTASTIPPDLVSFQDDEFVEEIERVNDLFFGNVEVSDNVLEVETNGNSDSDESDNGEAEDTVGLVLRETDVSEEHVQLNFHTKTCGCIRLFGKPCSEVVDWESLIDYRNHCLETTKSELDLMIRVQLFHHRKSGNLTESKKHKSKEREKSRQEYFFNGRQVCRDTFSFAHGVNRKKIDAIAKSLDVNGLVPRIHGNVGKSPKHALTVEDVRNIKQFLVSYANKFGLPLPGRLPNYRDSKVMLLPSDRTKADIHQEYLSAAENMQLRKVCLSEFKALWLNHCPNILIIKPASDLCHKCQSYVATIAKSGNLTEEQKTEKLADYQVHLDKAKGQRDHYRHQCDEAKAAFSSFTDEDKQRGN